MDTEVDVKSSIPMKPFDEGSDTESNGAAIIGGTFEKDSNKTARWRVVPETPMARTNTRKVVLVGVFSVIIVIILSLLTLNTYKLHKQGKKIKNIYRLSRTFLHRTHFLVFMFCIS